MRSAACLRDAVTGIDHEIVETDRFPGNDDADQIRYVASRPLRSHLG